jgi:hypothetical protein
METRVEFSLRCEPPFRETNATQLSAPCTHTHTFCDARLLIAGSKHPLVSNQPNAAHFRFSSDGQRSAGRMKEDLLFPSMNEHRDQLIAQLRKELNVTACRRQVCDTGLTELQSNLKQLGYMWGVCYFIAIRKFCPHPTPFHPNNSASGRNVKLHRKVQYRVWQPEVEAILQEHEQRRAHWHNPATRN